MELSVKKIHLWQNIANDIQDGVHLYSEIVINGSHDTCAFDNTHDISEAIFEKKHSFKAFFRRLFKEISSKNKYPLGKRIFRLFNVRNTMR